MPSLRNRAKRAFLLTGIAISCASCSSSRDVAKIDAPDGKAVAVITEKVAHGMPRVPEPPKVTGRWAKLTISRGAFSSVSTGFEALNIYDHAGFATDAAWSPDSSKLAYRRVNEFRVFGRDGNDRGYDVVSGNALISSFKWVDNNSLIVVTKTIDYALDTFGSPNFYHGYLARARGIRILRLNLATGVLEQRYARQFPQPANVKSLGKSGPTFIFRSAEFLMDEVSPDACRIAFGDGSNLYVYDDLAGKIIAQKPVRGQIEGVWWVDRDTVLLGLDLLSSQQRTFATFIISSQAIEDVTPKLLSHWHRDYDNMNWFRQARAAKN